MAKTATGKKKTTSKSTAAKATTSSSSKKYNKKRNLDDDDDEDVSEEEEEEYVEKKKSAKNVTTTKNGHKKVEDEEENGETEEGESHLFNDCLVHFKTKDLYEILQLDKKKASNSDIKKAYYKLALKYHPDKVTEEADKETSKLKFQLVGKIYSVLSDEEKKKMYDETGVVEGEDAFFGNREDRCWDEYFRMVFKKISEDDIIKFFDTYKDSADERQSLLEMYEKHKGDMDLILEEVISSDTLEAEKRFRVIITEAIENGECKKYAKFVNESQKKVAKRKEMYEQEAKEAEELRKKMKIGESEESLRKAIMARQDPARSDKFLDSLAQKYAQPAKKNTTNGKKK